VSRITTMRRYRIVYEVRPAEGREGHERDDGCVWMRLEGESGTPARFSVEVPHELDSRDRAIDLFCAELRAELKRER
jgi:hypothetical protein